MGIERAWGVAEMCMGGRKQVGWGCDGQLVGWNMRMCIERAWGGSKQYMGGHEWVMWVNEPRDQKMTKLKKKKTYLWLEMRRVSSPYCCCHWLVWMAVMVMAVVVMAVVV